jgi:hypothetical protein
MAIVRGFRRDAPGQIAPVGPGDLAFCRTVVAWDSGEENQNDRLDYAWIELDHPLGDPSITDADGGIADGAGPPLLFATDDAAGLGAPVVSFGYGGGGPVTMTTATVTDARQGHRDFFVTNLDAFRGMSGAPIFDARQRLVGIDNRGAPDLAWDAAGQCYRPAVLNEDAGAEAATHAMRALEGLCGVDPTRAVCSNGAAPLVTVNGGCDVNGHPGPRRGRPAALVLAGLAWILCVGRYRTPRPWRALERAVFLEAAPPRSTRAPHCAPYSPLVAARVSRSRRAWSSARGCARPMRTRPCRTRWVGPGRPWRGRWTGRRWCWSRRP